MESTDLEKQVNDLLTTPNFEQPQFDQSLKSIFSKEMLISSAGNSIISTARKYRWKIPTNRTASIRNIKYLSRNFNAEIWRQ